MEMNLSGEGGDFRFEIATWRDVPMLEHDHGWKPAGTEPGASVQPSIQRRLIKEVSKCRTTR